VGGIFRAGRRILQAILGADLPLCATCKIDILQAMATIKTLGICILAVVLPASSLTLEAQVIPGRWEKADKTVRGTQIVVRLQNRTTFEGAFQESTPDQITVVVNGGPVKIAKADVSEIKTEQVLRDSLKNGALIGTGIGLGVALGLLAVAASGDGYVLDSAKWAAPLLGLGAGLGAGIAVDASRHHPEVLYRFR
jgi:hypothetical protein